MYVFNVNPDENAANLSTFTCEMSRICLSIYIIIRCATIGHMEGLLCDI